MTICLRKNIELKIKYTCNIWNIKQVVISNQKVQIDKIVKYRYKTDFLRFNYTGQ